MTEAPHGCLVCEATDSCILYPGTFTGSVADAPQYFLSGRTRTAHGDIRKCRSCGFVFTAPRFSADEYDRIYARIQANDAAKAALGVADLHRFRRIAGLIRKTAPPNGRFLDFGCGSGAFLAAMDNPDGIGFEVGPSGERQVEGRRIVTGQWREVAGSAAIPPASLDFVVAIDVLEHLAELREDLLGIIQVLRPGGGLYLTVPDISSPVARLMGGRWSMLLLEHLWYFSPRTLSALLEQFGFAAVRTCRLPYDAPVGHIFTRLCQTFGIGGFRLPSFVADRVLPVPAGVFFAEFRLR